MTGETKSPLQFKMAKKLHLLFHRSHLQTGSVTRRYNQAVAHRTPNTVSSSSPVGQETVRISIPSSRCGLKWNSFKAKSEQRLLRDWKGSPSRSGRRSHHPTSNRSTKVCRGEWKQWLTPKVVTPSIEHICYMYLYYLLDKLTRSQKGDKLLS